MLREIKNVKQHEDEGIRRWFTDEYFDLILWYQEEELQGFQLCYDKNHKERSLIWRKGDSFAHNRVDDGEEPGQSKMTPMLVADGLFDKGGIAEKFRKHSPQMERPLARFVLSKIAQANVPCKE